MIDTTHCLFGDGQRIWDTLYTEVPIEKAYLGHVDLLPRSLDYNAILKMGK